MRSFGTDCKPILTLRVLQIVPAVIPSAPLETMLPAAGGLRPYIEALMFRRFFN